MLFRSASAEAFYRHAVGNVIPSETVEKMMAAFADQSSPAFAELRKKYGNRFRMADGAYWSTCLALAIDAQQISEVMQYLRLFTICLMEFAFMEDRNPDVTYAWIYYEAFRQMLDDLTTEPEPEPLPLKVRALGGTAGKREGDAYLLSLGIDIENPNTDRMARTVSLDITLKDRDGNVITVIKDQLQSIDPSAIYHYGVTRKIRGAAVASISATAKASTHLKLTTPIMKHLSLTSPRLAKGEAHMLLSGSLQSKYDRPLRAAVLHYQLLSADNKILGGANEWIFGGIPAKGSRPFSSKLAVSISGASKVIYSVDFDVMELIKED